MTSSDDFYTSAQLLNRPDRTRTMGEGWETRRRRDSGHDFVVFRLAFVGYVRQLIVDTAHFRHNATAVFPLADDVAVGSIRLDAYPDGGISRVRVIGSLEPVARRRAGYRWFNSMPADQAVVCLVAAGLPTEGAGELVGLRPLQETWLDERAEAGARAAKEPVGPDA